MSFVFKGLLFAVAILGVTAAQAAPLKLKPASPQPGGVKSGLSVRYAYPEDVRTLAEASSALKVASEPGRPLKGLDYRDTSEGQKPLTAKRPEHVVAKIRGYVKFDAPGVYTIDFLTNDGLHARVGGQTVGYFDGRQTCDTTIATDVEVPSAGWYKLDVLYFQRLKTACLHMRAGAAGGKVKWMPNSAFGH
jgi:hypothetical protein